MGACEAKPVDESQRFDESWTEDEILQEELAAARLHYGSQRLSFDEHIVAEDDTLMGISLTYGVSVALIR